MKMSDSVASSLKFAASRFAAVARVAALVLVFSANAFAQCGVPPKFKNEIGEPARPAESVPRRSALPSTLVYYVHRQNFLQPDWDQQKIAWPLLEIARRENLDDHERFFLAQLNFMSFKPIEAYEMFGEFADRDDWYGWMARQRQMIMDMRAFENFERLEEIIEKQQRDFTPHPEYASITGFGERALCARWASQGEHQRAAEFARRTIAATPKNAAYGELLLPIACYDSFAEIGRKSEALTLAQSVRVALESALAEREKRSGEYPPYDSALHENQIEDRWYQRSLIAPYNYQNFKMKQLVARFDAFLACRRDGKKDAC